MPGAPGVSGSARGGKLSFAVAALLGAFAGLTIFLGLPVARIRGLKAERINLLNAVAVGILAYLVVEIAGGATGPVSRGVTAWKSGAGPFPAAESLALAAGLLAGPAGLGFLSSSLGKHGKRHLSDRPLLLALTIAAGIGAHNFAECLAIGASAGSGQTAVAIGLIVGFALHNATEGFGVAAPLAGRVIPTWGQIALGGLIAGGPTFLGTLVGYVFNAPLLSIFFLALAVGALLFVIGELWSVLKKTGMTTLVTSSVSAGFIIAFVTELIVDANGG
jgi:ZIP family zinc transporter